MKKNNKFAIAYNYYQSDKLDNPFHLTPSKNTQKKLDLYNTASKLTKTSTLDLLFNLIR